MSWHQVEGVVSGTTPAAQMRTQIETFLALRPDAWEYVGETGVYVAAGVSGNRNSRVWKCKATADPLLGIDFHVFLETTDNSATELTIMCAEGWNSATPGSVFNPCTVSWPPPNADLGAGTVALTANVSTGQTRAMFRGVKWSVTSSSYFDLYVNLGKTGLTMSMNNAGSGQYGVYVGSYVPHHPISVPPLHITGQAVSAGNGKGAVSRLPGRVVGSFTSSGTSESHGLMAPESRLGGGIGATSAKADPITGTIMCSRAVVVGPDNVAGITQPQTEALGMVRGYHPADRFLVVPEFTSSGPRNGDFILIEGVKYQRAFITYNNYQAVYVNPEADW